MSLWRGFRGCGFLNQSEVISALAQSSGITKKLATEVINNFLEIVMDEVSSNGRIVLYGFGAFEIKENSPRKCINPNTGESYIRPASRAPVFRPGKSFKRRIR